LTFGSLFKYIANSRPKKKTVVVFFFFLLLLLLLLLSSSFFTSFSEVWMVPQFSVVQVQQQCLAHALGNYIMVHSKNATKTWGTPRPTSSFWSGYQLDNSLLYTVIGNAWKSHKKYPFSTTWLALEFQVKNLWRKPL